MEICRVGQRRARCIGACLGVSVLFLALFVSGCGSKLESAAGNGDITEVRKVLSSDKASVSQEDLDAALDAAVYEGHSDVVELLLHEGADPKRQGAQGWTLLHDAAWGGHEGVRHLEDEKRANVTGAIAPWDPEYARIASLLIENGATINTTTVGSLKWGYDSGTFQTPSGFTPLHAASYIGYTDMVKLLVSKGADTNTRDAGGDTPLDLAKRMGRADAVKALTELGSRKIPQ